MLMDYNNRSTLQTLKCSRSSASYNLITRLCLKSGWQASKKDPIYRDTRTIMATSYVSIVFRHEIHLGPIFLKRLKMVTIDFVFKFPSDVTSRS